MDPRAAKTVLESNAIQDYIKYVEEDAENALAEMDRILAAMSSFPNRMISEYKSDRKALEDAWKIFNYHVTAVTLEKSTDGKKVTTSFQRLAVRITILEEQNARFGAYVDQNIVGITSVLLAVLIPYLKKLAARAKSLEKELVATRADLARALRLVKQAEHQRLINIAITLISLVIPQATLIKKIAVAGSSFGLSLVVDSVLGPSKPALPGILNTAAGDIAGVTRKEVLSPLRRAVTAFSAIMTIKFDTDEVEEARRAVAQLRSRKRTLETMLSRFGTLKSDAVRIERMQKALETGLRRARSRARSFKPSESRRQALLKELESIR